MKKWFSFFSVLLFSGVAVAQTTIVVGVATDSDSTLWVNGTVSAQFVPNPAQPNLNVYRINGAPLSSAVIMQGPISLGSGGNFSVTVYDNTQITPSGSQWQFTVCPNASSKCGSVTTAVSGSGQSITTLIDAAIPAPRFPAVAGSFGYVDVEGILSTPVGGTYWNVVSSCQRYYNGSSWSCGSLPAGNTFPGPITAPVVNEVYAVDGLTYSSVNAALTACEGSSSSGCTIDARGGLGSHALGTIQATKPTTILLGPFQDYTANQIVLVNGFHLIGASEGFSTTITSSSTTNQALLTATQTTIGSNQYVTGVVVQDIAFNPASGATTQDGMFLDMSNPNNSVVDCFMYSTFQDLSFGTFPGVSIHLRSDDNGGHVVQFTNFYNVNAFRASSATSQSLRIEGDIGQVHFYSGEIEAWNWSDNGTNIYIGEYNGGSRNPYSISFANTSMQGGAVIAQFNGANNITFQGTHHEGISGHTNGFLFTLGGSQNYDILFDGITMAANIANGPYTNPGPGCSADTSTTQGFVFNTYCSGTVNGMVVRDSYLPANSGVQVLVNNSNTPMQNNLFRDNTYSGIPITSHGTPVLQLTGSSTIGLGVAEQYYVLGTNAISTINGINMPGQKVTFIAAQAGVNFSIAGNINLPGLASLTLQYGQSASFMYNDITSKWDLIAGGVASINSQTGPAINIHSSDASVTVTTTTNDINLQVSGGSGCTATGAAGVAIVTDGSGHCIPATGSVSTGTGGTAAGVTLPEGTALTPTAGYDILNTNSSTHTLDLSTNGGAFSHVCTAANGYCAAASAGPQFKQYTYVADSTAASVTSPSLTIAAGDLLVVSCRFASSTGSTGIATDSHSNSYSALAAQVNSPQAVGIQASWAIASASGATTFTCTQGGSAAGISLIALDYSNGTGTTVNTSSGGILSSFQTRITSPSYATSQRTLNVFCSAVNSISGFFDPLWIGGNSAQLVGASAAGVEIVGADQGCESIAIPYAVPGATANMQYSVSIYAAQTAVAFNY